MGKTQGYNPLGKWVGRVGGEVYKVVDGQQIVTPYEKHERSEQTVSQMAVQVRMALAGKLSAITPAEALLGLPGSKTDRRNRLTSNIMRATTVSVVGSQFIARLNVEDLLISEGRTGVVDEALVLSGTHVMGVVTPRTDDINQVMIVAYGMNYNGEYTTCKYQVVNALKDTESVIDIDMEMTPAVVQVYSIPIFFTTSGQRYYSEHRFAYLPQSDNGAYIFSAMLSAGSNNVEYGASEFCAQFGSGVTYRTLTLTASPAGWGTVSGAGTYADGTNVLISASAGAGYQFSRWSDGNTENPRTIQLDSNKTLQGIFEAAAGSSASVNLLPGNGSFLNEALTNEAIEVSYRVNNGEWFIMASGTSSIPGLTAGDKVELRAQATSPYTFTGFSNNATSGTDTQYTIASLSNGSNNVYVFVGKRAGNYTVTVNASPSQGGTVSGGGSYAAGAIADLVATANTGYEFVSWSDGNTSASRSVTVNSNLSLTATFRQTSPAGGTLTLANGGGISQMKYQVFANNAEYAEAVDSGQNDPNNTYSAPVTVTPGQYVWVKAYLATDYTFMGWKQTDDNGQVLSADRDYQFTFNNATTLFADAEQYEG